MHEQEPRLGDHDRRDGEVMAAQPEERIAERERDEGRDPAARQHAEPGRDAGMRIEQRRHIRADAEIDGVTERDLPAIAAENVPALRERRIHQSEDQDVLQIDIMDDERQESHSKGGDPRDGKLAMPASREATQRRIVIDAVAFAAFRFGGSRDDGVLGGSFCSTIFRGFRRDRAGA